MQRRSESKHVGERLLPHFEILVILPSNLIKILKLVF